MLQQAGRVDTLKLGNAEEEATLSPKACKRLGSHFLLSERVLMHIMLPDEHLQRLKPEDTDNTRNDTEGQFRRREKREVKQVTYAGDGEDEAQKEERATYNPP